MIKCFGMEVRHETLILFIIYFYLTRVSIIVSALHKSETSDRNKQEYLPFGHFSSAFIFFLINVLRHLYNFTFWSLFVLRNEHCWLHRWDADCELFMHCVAFTLWSPGLSFLKADICDVKSNGKDLLAMPASSLQCKTSGQIFVNCCNQFGKDKSHGFAELPLFH